MGDRPDAADGALAARLLARACSHVAAVTCDARHVPISCRGCVADRNETVYKPVMTSSARRRSYQPRAKSSRRPFVEVSAAGAPAGSFEDKKLRYLRRVLYLARR